MFRPGWLNLSTRIQKPGQDSDVRGCGFELASSIIRAGFDDLRAAKSFTAFPIKRFNVQELHPAWRFSLCSLSVVEWTA